MDRQLTSITQSFKDIFQRHPRTIAVTSLLCIVTPKLAYRLVNNYRAFLALGRGGLPSNIFGWSLAMVAKPFGSETLSIAMYDGDPNKDFWLDEQHIPERRGDRPRTGWHFLPHRQTTKHPSDDVKERLKAMFYKHAAENPQLVEIAVSPHERMHDAMVISASRPSPHKVADHAMREIAHFHPEIDFSLHVTLSPKDCKLAIERGWGERHPLSGTIALPKEYLLVYAPRNDEELDVVERIVVATIGYMTGTKEVN
ncbi:hypothetical protein BJ138DRAFT_1109523 [Hygrophoropsis aurantiaca]|uniref:Uncharacterized protein n=1 Tax=Hygrophoropsis aurantiaca TaxID=72124 RepID=A0ACB8ART2_9AGAM|nr:hypothetical protein BJ138DRAFT_1109523 [Hygrophoropsis aurantiaca]